MIQTMILIAETLAMSVVLVHSVCALNHMTRETRPVLKAGVVLVFGGAFTHIYLLVMGEAEPSLIEAIFESGIALGMLANQRRSVRCPCLPAWPHEPVAGKTDKEHPA